MSGTLALPLHCSLDTTDYVFKITQVGSGGYAIWAESYGTDPWGDVPTGVLGQSDIGNGVFGFSTSGVGIFGQSQSSTAIVGTGGYNGVHGVTANPHASGVWGENTASGYGVGGKSAGGIGVYGTGTPAGYFDGDVQVQGDVGVLGDVLLYNPSSGDVAEDFDLDDGSTQAEPGTVLVIGPSGRLSASMAAYDTRVAGVVSGAGSLTPAIVLQRVKSRAIRSPVALIGSVLQGGRVIRTHLCWRSAYHFIDDGPCNEGHRSFASVWCGSWEGIGKRPGPYPDLGQSKIIGRNCMPQRGDLVP